MSADTFSVSWAAKTSLHVRKEKMAFLSTPRACLFLHAGLQKHCSFVRKGMDRSADPHGMHTYSIRTPSEKSIAIMSRLRLIRLSTLTACDTLLAHWVGEARHFCQGCHAFVIDAAHKISSTIASLVVNKGLNSYRIFYSSTESLD